MKLPSKKLLDFMIMVLHSQTIANNPIKVYIPKKRRGNSIKEDD